MMLESSSGRRPGWHHKGRPMQNTLDMPVIHSLHPGKVFERVDHAMEGVATELAHEYLDCRPVPDCAAAVLYEIGHSEAVKGVL